jgi:hypothetical protein
VPFNLKNKFNAGSTETDAARFGVPITAVLTALGTDPAHISALAGVALATGDMLHLNTNKTTHPNTGSGGGDPATPNGFPNGRRLRDDVVDIELGIINNGDPLTDNANSNDLTFQNTFPFLAAPQGPRETPGAPQPPDVNDDVDDNTEN